MPAPLAAYLVLLTSAAVLVLEILVSRLVAPYVGLTLETYTAAIGVALAAIAAGAALGGRLADTRDPRRWLGVATAVGGALVLAARPVVLALGEGFRGSGPIGTVVLVGVAVGPAALVLSLVPPGVVKLRLRTLAETGQTVGRLSAVGTLGALAGTFLTGFVLLSALPTSQLLLVIGALLVVSGVGVALLLPRSGVAAAPLAGVVALSLLTASWLLLADSSCHYETRYYCATIEADPERGSGRILVLDGLRHSYVDLQDAEHLEFTYTRWIADVLAEQPPGALDVLHLGLGGGSLPRHLAAVRPGSRSTVLEVDPQLPDIGRNELGLDAVPDLEIVVADARTAIAELPDDSYDVVVGDAFGSRAVPWHLTTVEMLAQVQRVLEPGGIYALNVIDQPPLSFARAQTATLLASFDEVVVLARPAGLAGNEGGNFVLVASDGPVDPEALAARSAVRGESGGVAGREHAEQFAGDAQVLTDDDAPVDQLLSTYRAPRA